MQAAKDRFDRWDSYGRRTHPFDPQEPVANGRYWASYPRTSGLRVFYLAVRTVRAKFLEHFASVGCLGDHPHVRLSRRKVSNAATDEPVIVDRLDADYIGVAAHDCGFLALAVNALASQEPLALCAES